MKKLLFIGSIPPPVHGVTVYNYNILNSNFKSFFKIKYLDTSDHRNSENYNKLDLRNIFIGIKNIIFLCYYLLVFRPDIVYCAPAPYTKPFIRESIFIILSKILSSAKIVAHMHAGKFFNQDFYNKSNFLMKFIINKTLRICDCGIVLGENLIQHYNSFFEKTFFLWNGINIEGERIINKSSKNNDKIVIGYLSNLCEAKGILTFIKGINSLPSEIMEKIKIIISGDWMHNEKKTRNEFYKLLDINKFKSEISILEGIYSPDRKNSFYSNIDIFVFPSNMEAFGLVNLEAMYHECAVISTYEGAIPEIVINEKTGYLINKNDYIDLSHKLITLINSPEKIIRFAKAGKERVLDNFTMQHNINRLKNIINKIMDK